MEFGFWNVYRIGTGKQFLRYKFNVFQSWWFVYIDIKYMQVVRWGTNKCVYHFVGASFLILIRNISHCMTIWDDIVLATKIRELENYEDLVISVIDSLHIENLMSPFFSECTKAYNYLSCVSYTSCLPLIYISIGEKCGVSTT